MKLTELKENIDYESWSDPKAHYEGLIEDALENGNFGPVMNPVLERLTDEEWKQLVGSQRLLDAAIGSYDAADDTGPTINIDARDVAKALIELGFENK